MAEYKWAKSDLEWAFLLSACSANSTGALTVESLSRSPFRWDRLLSLAENQGVLPLLCQALECLPNSIPVEHFTSLAQKYKANLRKALILSAELIRVVDALAASQIEVMPYKGLVLAEVMYKDLALRQAGDIDLFLRPADLARAREILRALGYTPHKQLSKLEERAYLRSGYECAFDSAAGRNVLEIHWAIQPRFYAVDFNLEELFQRAATVSVAGREIKTLSSEDSFIILGLHAAKHLWERLIWICDLARIMEDEDLDWDQVGSVAKRLGIQRILGIGLVLTRRLLGATIPRAAEKSIPADSEALRLAAQVESYLLSDKVLDVDSVAYFRMMLQLRENPSDRMRFLSRFILTPGPGEWSAFRLPSPLFPLYPIVRSFRLGARLLRL